MRFCSNKIWHSIIAIVCLALARYYCNVVVLRVRAGLNKGAFSFCKALYSIVIPENVTTIGDKAFASCTTLKFVTIPASVTHIGYSAFYCCFVLNNVTFENASGWRLTTNEEIVSDKTIDIPESDLKDNGKAAKYLRDYAIYCWDRVFS